MKKYLLTLPAIVFIVNQLFTPAFAKCVSPTGELFGYVKDSISGDMLPFAVVMIKSGETVMGGAETDANGSYKISGIPPGIYTVEAHYTNYGVISARGVLISAEKTSRLDFSLYGNVNDDIVVVFPRIPLIEPNEVSVPFTLTADQIADLPIRNVTDMLPLAAGIFQADAGGAINVRGSRADATQYIIDGVKIMGQPDVPSGAINQMSVFTGGIPATYGDATGGFVIITTKSYFSH